MKKYKIITLVDVTRSKATRTETDKIKIGQQSNFNSLIQAIGLRSNVEWTSDPKVSEGRLPDGNGKSKYWTWVFYSEREGLWNKDGDPVGLLKDDINKVPILNNLTNDIEIVPACFITIGDNLNTWVYEISELE